MTAELSYKTPAVTGSILPVLTVGSASIVAAVVHIEFGSFVGALAAWLVGAVSDSSLMLRATVSALLVLAISALVAWLHVKLLRGVFDGRTTSLAIAMAEGALLAIVNAGVFVCGLMWLDLWTDLFATLLVLVPVFLIFLLAAKAVILEICLLGQSPRTDPSSHPPRAVAVSWYSQDATIIAAALSWPLAILLFVVPKFAEIFKDFRVNLPTLTEWAVSLAHLSEEYGGFFLLLALVLSFSIPAPMLIYRLIHPPAKRDRRLLPIFSLALLITFLIAIPLFLSLVLPLLQLFQSVQGEDPVR